MKHDELVERVALAIAISDNEGGDFGMTGRDAMDDERAREFYEKRARAALAAVYEAMKEPTPEMVRAAMRRNRMDDPFASADVTAYRAMIAASPLNPEAGE